MVIGMLAAMETALVNEYFRLSRDAATHQPLAYLRLRRAIRNVVEHRDIEPGQALPSERDLSRALSLSRVTVRKAIAGLVEEGILTQRHALIRLQHLVWKAIWKNRPARKKVNKYLTYTDATGS